MFSTLIAAAACCGAWVFAATDGQVSLNPAKVKQINEINKNYRSCVDGYTADVRSGRIKVVQLPESLRRCKERFPGAALYVDCKKRVLTTVKSTDLDVKDVAECRKYLTGATFDASDPVPYFISGDEAFFGGIGLNDDLKISDLQPPNFDCGRLKLAVGAIAEKAQFILFGNSPDVFVAGGKDQLSRYLGSVNKAVAAKKGAKSVDVEGFGRLFPDPKSGQTMTYFAAAPCDFNGAIGNNFSGLSAFYLLDAKTQLASPYFGITYYKQGQRGVTTPELVTEIQRRLGPLYRAYSKDSTTVFVAASPFSEVDQERDPRNICKSPRPHRFVAIIHTSAADANRPEYLIVANIKNMCDYGDRLARRMGQ